MPDQEQKHASDTSPHQGNYKNTQGSTVLGLIWSLKPKHRIRTLSRAQWRITIQRNMQGRINILQTTVCREESKYVTTSQYQRGLPVFHCD